MRTIVFDLDGTLADTAADLLAAANAVLPRAVLGPADAVTAGQGGRAMLRLGYQRLGMAGEIERDYPRLLAVYAEGICVQTTLYPGAVAAVEVLRGMGCATAICTNKPEALAVELVRRLGDGILRLDVFEVLLRLKPRLVAFTHVSNTLGTINPVREMVEMAHAAGALVLVDGAQAVPHVPVDVQALGCDFYAFSGHKMLGPMGSGALWARREILESMPPFLSGGEMIREVHLRRSEFNEIPWKFEAGTPAVGDAIGLGVAAEYLMDLGMDAVREHERELVTYALDVLPREIPGIELYGPMDPDVRGGVVPFNLPGIHPHDVAQVLDRSGIAVRAGHHCTMPLHERLDLAATARASFSVYSTTADVDALVAGLKDVQRVFAG